MHYLVTMTPTYDAGNAPTSSSTSGFDARAPRPTFTPVVLGAQAAGTIPAARAVAATAP